MNVRLVTIAVSVLSILGVEAARTGPWTKEKAWEWYDRQPWMRGCNYRSGDFCFGTHIFQ